MISDFKTNSFLLRSIGKKIPDRLSSVIHVRQFKIYNAKASSIFKQEKKVRRSTGNFRYSGQFFFGIQFTSVTVKKGNTAFKTAWHSRSCQQYSKKGNLEFQMLNPIGGTQATEIPSANLRNRGAFVLESSEKYTGWLTRMFRAEACKRLSLIM